jgi:hypothetical protein
LAPLHVGSVKSAPTTNFPPTTSPGSKHLAPLSVPSVSGSSLGATSRKLEDSGPLSGSRSFGHEDKLSSGSLLEQSTESVEEIKNDDSYYEDEGNNEALSPYVGDRDKRVEDTLEGSGTIESSFEASSYVEREEAAKRELKSPVGSPVGSPSSGHNSGPSKRNVKSVEVGSARDFDAFSDDEV